jgi:hypothetical protein
MMSNKPTYRHYKQLRRRKEFDEINEIRIRLEERDIIENNPDWMPVYFWNGHRWQLEIEWAKSCRVVDYYEFNINRKGNFKYTRWLVKRTYYPDIWYLFELLEWSRSKRYTL